MNIREYSRRWSLAKIVHIAIAMVAMATRTIAFSPSMQNYAVNVRNSKFISATTQSPTVQMKVSATSLIESRPKSFEDRMKDMMRGRRTKPVVETVNSKIPKNIMVVKTLEEYKHVVGGERDRIVVVRFFAPWCKVRCRQANRIRSSSSSTSYFPGYSDFRFTALPGSFEIQVTDIRPVTFFFCSLTPLFHDYILCLGLQSNCSPLLPNGK